MLLFFREVALQTCSWQNVLKNYSSKFTWEHPCRILISIKLLCNLQICCIFSEHVSQEHLWRAASKVIIYIIPFEVNVPLYLEAYKRSETSIEKEIFFQQKSTFSLACQTFGACDIQNRVKYWIIHCMTIYTFCDDKKSSKTIGLRPTILLKKRLWQRCFV